ncbi:hypothetical protein P4O66_012727 [Electrophorus voltai]|uniref:EGF-like domain-containing protein n=1 Tax=Electrophorus voltai TaxID=2609070 RepID=A0AAD8Z777_9TELE|nr:hypothetical protein P4O66_012727 [Electrophorus voltai]
MSKLAFSTAEQVFFLFSTKTITFSVMVLQMWYGTHLLWIGLFVGAMADAGASLKFSGAEGQWAAFPMWNACCESEMSFSMKTKSSSGLLVYLDDEGFCDFLELLVSGGKLRLRFSIFCAEPVMALSDVEVDDGEWHAIAIKRNFKNTTLVVDQEVKWVEVKSKRRDMTVFSHLYLGGIPPELRSVALRLTSDVVKDQIPFKGWIADLKVNNSVPSMLNSGGVERDLCGSANVCMNGGVCSIVNDEPTCDCSETGYQGKDCSEGKMCGFAFCHVYCFPKTLRMEPYLCPQSWHYLFIISECVVTNGAGQRTGAWPRATAFPQGSDYYCCRWDLRKERLIRRHRVARGSQRLRAGWLPAFRRKLGPERRAEWQSLGGNGSLPFVPRAPARCSRDAGSGGVSMARVPTPKSPMPGYGSSDGVVPPARAIIPYRICYGSFSVSFQRSG